MLMGPRSGARSPCHGPTKNGPKADKIPSKSSTGSQYTISEGGSGSLPGRLRVAQSTVQVQVLYVQKVLYVHKSTASDFVRTKPVYIATSEWPRQCRAAGGRLAGGRVRV